jgi:heterodisulfide reductase subunit C
MSVRILFRDLDGEILKKVAEISGENAYLCMQCGTCSAVCPMVDSMELNSRQVMLMLQHGQTEPLIESKTPWLCASCHTCQVRCPRGIEIPRLMEAIRQIQLRQNVDRIDPREIPPEKVADMPQIALVAGFRKLTA